jgi:CubicO group peptidase (beta-lactamase class C family)
MEDFDPARQRMLGYEPRRSRYLAYHFFLSCRDMAKLGQLMLGNGRWQGRQLIPASWVAASTSRHVPGSRTNASRLGYGYLWWILSDVRPGAAFHGAFAALGNYGQYLVVLPALDLVVVHRRAVTDDFAIARNLGQTQAEPAGGAAPLLPILDKIVEGIAA